MRSALTVLALILAICACSPGEKAREQGPGPELVAASPEGVIVLDPRERSFSGVARTGLRTWRDTVAYEQGSTAICLSRCPDAVFSGAWEPPHPSPRRPGPAGVQAFPGPGSPIYRVLSARSATDAVIAEGPRDGAGRLRLLRTGAAPTSLAVPSAAEVAWAENPQRTLALAVIAGKALWFRRDQRGWRPLQARVPVGAAWGACTAGDGELAVIVGERPALLLDRTRTITITTDLAVTGECAAGRSGAVVLARWRDQAGAPHTAIRGLDATGAQTWARDIAAEAQVRAHPSGTRFVLTYGTAAEVVDQAGRVVARHPGVLSAAYTSAGELVLLDGDGTPQWLAAG
ncbi:hypothetical protein [Spongiactinospora sp. 9N601]|uniref:hypothetical protein n=1 Tax=Spongiactinospora sp. 9N601 TaxID=3375149 RepID=UPI0037908C0E